MYVMHTIKRCRHVYLRAVSAVACLLARLLRERVHAMMQGWVLIACVAALCMAAQGQTVEEMAAYQRWLTQHPHWDDRVEVKMSGEQRGVFAKVDMEKGTILFDVPTSEWITQANVAADPDFAVRGAQCMFRIHSASIGIVMLECAWRLIRRA